MKTFAHSLTVLSVVLLVVPAHAQHRLGVATGLNLANVSTDDDADLKSRTGFAIGGIAELSVTENVSILVEPMYIQKGAKLEETDPEVGTVVAKFKLDYVELPILVKVGLSTNGVRPYFKLGPTIALSSSTELAFEALGESVDVDVGDFFKSLDFGLAFGGGVSLPVGRTTAVFVEGGYALGLLNIFDEGSVDVDGEEVPLEGDVKTNGFQFIVGITFPVGGR